MTNPTEIKGLVEAKPVEWYAVKRAPKSTYQFYEPNKNNLSTIHAIAPIGGNFELITLIDKQYYDKAIQAIEALQSDNERLQSEARLHDTIITQLQRANSAYINQLEKKAAFSEEQFKGKAIRNGENVIERDKLTDRLDLARKLVKQGVEHKINSVDKVELLIQIEGYQLLLKRIADEMDKP